MIYPHDYNSAYSPAMPVVEVTLENVETGTQGEKLTAIVDSGADGCILPVKYLEAIGSESIRKTQMVGVAGIGVQVEIHLLVLHLGPLTVYGVEAVADKQNGEAIIGHNVLNQLVVTLNGMAGVTEITD
ncbi:retroviral-like aspartic protease family protein [Chloroflexi bacterium TSY]|nr:retroviral-like aspartic protease family protein [Chloroflexi bacterium TSY]